MKKFKMRTAVPALALAGALILANTAHAQEFITPPDGTPPGAAGPTVYVTGQGLAYDSIALTPLPPTGPFQRLLLGGPTGLMTEFGPGDQEYVGGRWWLDLNGNNMVDMGEPFFSCPLLGLGYDPS